MSDRAKLQVRIAARAGSFDSILEWPLPFNLRLLLYPQNAPAGTPPVTCMLRLSDKVEGHLLPDGPAYGLQLAARSLSALHLLKDDTQIAFSVDFLEWTAEDRALASHAIAEKERAARVKAEEAARVKAEEEAAAALKAAQERAAQEGKCCC